MSQVRFFYDAVVVHGVDQHSSPIERCLGCFQLLQIKPLAIFVYRFPCEHTFPLLWDKCLGRIAVSGSKCTVTCIRN